MRGTKIKRLLPQRDIEMFESERGVVWTRVWNGTELVSLGHVGHVGCVAPLVGDGLCCASADSELLVGIETAGGH